MRANDTWARDGDGTATSPRGLVEARVGVTSYMPIRCIGRSSGIGGVDPIGFIVHRDERDSGRGYIRPAGAGVTAEGGLRECRSLSRTTPPSKDCYPSGARRRAGTTAVGSWCIGTTAGWIAPVARRHGPCIVALIGALHWCGTVRGTTILPCSFDEVCTQADAVFHGRVESVTSDRDGATGLVHTWTAFSVIEWIAGKSERTTYALRTLGGEAHGESVRVEGMPRFDVGGEYIVFVREGGRFICPLVGWHQGCFRVDRPTASGEQAPRGSAKCSAVVRDYHQRTITGIRGGRLLRLSGTAEATTIGSVSTVSAGDPVTMERPMTTVAFIAEVRLIRARSGLTPRAGFEP